MDCRLDLSLEINDRNVCQSSGLPLKRLTRETLLCPWTSPVTKIEETQQEKGYN